MKEVGYNKKAKFDYEILETFESGIVLSGSEVKSLRANKAGMTDSYATVTQDKEVIIYNLHIPQYEMSTAKNYDSKKNRKLLLHRRQIERIAGYLQKGGYTLVPISVYFGKNGYVKVQVGIGKGKKLVDKRETIKEREWNREKSRILKRDY